MMPSIDFFFFIFSLFSQLNKIKGKEFLMKAHVWEFPHFPPLVGDFLLGS